MECSADLYSGSIAKYGASTPQVTLAGGEVGIPQSIANDYYTQALNAAKEIIDGGEYSLYQQKPDLSDNFASIFIDKANNPESIFIEDLTTDKLFAKHLNLALQNNIIAVRSAPLISSLGKVIGMISVHFNTPRKFSKDRNEETESFCRKAADKIEELIS